MKKILTMIIVFPFLVIVFIISLVVLALQYIGILSTKTYPDNIDRQKTLANLYVLKHRTFESAKSMSRFDEEEEKLLKHATESIKKFDFDRRPSGFTLEFIATYPDVVFWLGNLPDEDEKRLFDQYDEKDIIDNNGQIKPEHLRSIVDAYKATGAKLECSYD